MAGTRERIIIKGIVKHPQEYEVYLHKSRQLIEPSFFSSLIIRLKVFFLARFGWMALLFLDISEKCSGYSSLCLYSSSLMLHALSS